MKKTIIYALSLLLLCALMLALASCSDPETPCTEHVDTDEDGICDVCKSAISPAPKPDTAPDVSDISLEDKSVAYNGEAHSISVKGELPDGVTVEYLGNGKVDVGVYEVIAKFYYKGAEIAKSALKATLTITKGTYDMSGIHLLSVSKTYDGIEVVPTLTGTLPKGVEATLTYKNALGETVDKMVAAGKYTVFATFSSNNTNYYPIDPISATVTIEAPAVDGITLDDLTVAYDGAPHTILIKGTLPAGVRVVYEGGDKTAVGEYEVTAKFYIGEQELVEDRLTATLTITKATVNTSGLSTTATTGEYNGSPHTPTLIGQLPAGVSVEYTYRDSMNNAVDEIVNAGAYKVTATFVYDTACYNTISPIVFNYTVLKVGYDASEMHPASITKVYDGVAVRPTLAGTLPTGFEIEYTYKDASGKTVEEILSVGEYTVVATFICDESNYDKPEPVPFIYTVTKGTYDMSGVSLSPLKKTYDGKALELSIGSLPSGLTASVVIKNSLGATVSQMVNAGTYTVSVTFSGDFDNYYPVNAMTATVLIEKAPISGISFTDAVFSFDGEKKSISVVGAPDWLEITYVGNGVSAPGTYTVTATFAEYENYLPISPMQAKIIIEIDKSTPTEGITFEEYQDGYAVSGAKGDERVIVIPSTYNNKPVLSVKSFAFEGNGKLLYVYVPSSVINIGNRAFADCTSLATVEFGDIKVIGQQAFKNTAIKEISLPNSLESIGHAAFADTKLEKMTLPFVGGSRHSSSAYIGFIFGGSTYTANAMKVPETLTTVVLSNGCTTVPPRAFYGLSSLREVVLGHTVTEIGNSAFQGCSSLRSIYIPASLSAIPANAKAENSPFYGTAEDMMLVVESIYSVSAWGQYFSYIDEDKTAFIVYGKTYDDYVMNKESYRVPDPANATLVGIFVGGNMMTGFDPAVYEYTLDHDVALALPKVFAIAAESGATVTVEAASASNGSVATITVKSINGEVTRVYKVKFNVKGSFSATADVVNKDGAKGTVTFVVDDGYRPTASFMRTMMEKYAKLSVTYAVYTKNFLTTSEEYKTDNGLIIDDIDGDGLNEYVLDENGKYTYVRNEEAIDFWRDILSVGRSEIIPHSHTHAFWGVNDEGGAQLTASTSNKISTRIYSTLAEGSATKEIYASMQIIKDIFGISKGLTYVNAGIPPKEGDTTVTADVNVYLAKQTVRVLYDTKVTVTGDKIYLPELTWVNLQSTVGTLPANTTIKTTADVSSGTIPAGTPIYLASDYVTVPTLDPDGNTNVVKGFKAYIKELYAQAFEDGTFIGARTSGRQVYVASDFLDVENRIYRQAYIIATSTNDPAMPDSWKQHIDSAMAKNGGWASFCIHAMTEDINEEGQGGHKITWEQAEALFSYACSKGDDLWIASQTDATMYYHEWSTATVTASYDKSGNEISVSLTDKENDDVYNMPLTVKVSVPGNWVSATANGKELTIRTNDDGTCYVYVDVAPETTVSVIGK